MKKIIKLFLVFSLLISGFVYKNSTNVQAIEVVHPLQTYDISVKKNTSTSFSRKIKDEDLSIKYNEEYYNLYFDYYEPDTNYTYFYEGENASRYLVYTGCVDPSTSDTKSELHFYYNREGWATSYKTMEIYQFSPDKEYYMYTLSEVSSIDISKGYYKAKFTYKIDREKYMDDEYLYFMFALIKDNKIDDYEVFKMNNPYYYHNEISKVEIEQTSNKVFVGETLQLNAKVTPIYTSYDKTVTWESSDESIATVDQNGLVSGLKYGDVRITAKAVNGVSSYVDVKVRVAPERIEVVENLVVNSNEYSVLDVVVYPSEAADDLKLEYEKDNMDLIIVQPNGKLSYRIYAKDGGKGKITFKTENGLSATCNIETVYPLTDVNSSYILDRIVPGETIQLDYYTIPEHPTDDAQITWEIENEEIASVSGDAYVTGKAYGTTKLIAKIDGKQVSEFDVRVCDDPLRVYGNTRYETSYKVAKLMKEKMGIDKFDTIVVTTGTSYPDALSGSYLAIKNDAPLIMTTESRYDELVEFLKDNLVNGGKVYILGGENALPLTLENKLSDYEVKRLSGATRYETNMLVLNEAGVTTEDILVCTGQNYADSLSASATGKPILLVNTVNNQLYDYQEEFLSNHLENKKYIIGGHAAVSDDMQDVIRNYGSVDRLEGSERIATSVSVSRFFKPYDEIVLVYSHNFPDGLSGGPLAYLLNAPIILMNDNYDEKTYISNDLVYATILGGPSLISDDTVLTIIRENKKIKVVDYK